MRLLRVVVVIAGLLLEGADSFAQPAERSLIDLKASVLDRVFPLGGESRPRWLSKLIVRYSAPWEDLTQSDGQLVLVTYFVDPPLHLVPECELITYKVHSKTGEPLSKLITRMIDQNPNVSEAEIAAAAEVDIRRRPIPLEERDKLLDSLASLRLSPVLLNRVCVDACPRFDYWYDTGQDLVHYALTGGSGKERQDRLNQWMIKFRTAYLDSGKSP